MLRWAIISAILYSVIAAGSETVHYGPMTTTEDDAISQVECPPATVGVSCECEDKANCDGGFFTDARTCKISHTSRRPITRAVVKCIPMKRKCTPPQDIRNPSNPRSDDNKHVLNLTCPTDTTLTNCVLHSSRMHYKQMRSTHVVVSGNTCQVNEKCYKGCSIQARCIKDLQTGDETTVTGDMTSKGDDAKAFAHCPAETVGITCKCENVQACDGAYFTDARTCQILHAKGRPITRPIATCSAETARAMCVDLLPMDIRAPERGYDTTKILTATCPSTHTLTGCYLHSPWSHEGSAIETVMDGNTCKASKICSFRCSIYARCLPKN